MNTNNVIEINGKRYDAVTGAFLGQNASPSNAKPEIRGHAVDGFRRASRSNRLATSISHPIPAAASHTVKTVAAPKPRKPHTPGIHTKAHAPQPAKTLMRTIVKKPSVKSPAVIKAQTRTDLLAKVPAQTVVPKLSHTKVDTHRLRRANRIIQSSEVAKYSPAQPVPVRHKANPTATPPAAAAPVVRQSAPVRSDLRSARPSFTAASPRPQQSAPGNRPNNAAMFDQALASAKIQQQAFHTPRKTPKKTSRRYAAGAVTAVMLVMVGFISYQNLPNINMKVASHKSGVEARLPGYKPSGFSLNNLDYTQGKVTVKYNSDSDQTQSFNVYQIASDWNSKTLLDNFVSTTTKSYQTIERAGRTIYIYGNNTTATWVDSGVWITIEGNANLSQTQLLDMALSL